MARWCNSCNAKIDFIPKVVDGIKRWIPIDAEVHNKNYGLDHRQVCKPDKTYITKRVKIMKDPPLQIDNEFY